MNIVGIITFLSLSLLLTSLLLIYSKLQHQTPIKLAAIIVFFLLNAVPLVYIVYTEQSMNYASNSFSLGSAFMIVWLITAVIMFIGILFRSRSGNEDPYY
ncbi:hypothetical protein M4D56_08130 [Cytobacillus oceanisediminis]|uniref:hypothetical protein n=1 Tax=Cytobacillus TaxID=2675230 RepID=UPI002041FA26|nr:hypothetical protein [Cytobacillus oceanisediminis]MBY0159399.1 hypothetical protein [Cytobacillus firmus]MCM3391524.1 hypothetical protein [Cytobacillus oceanisediminis]MCM3529061.1 hypothetical protein [Cytobacillus oceanisediminis]